MNKNRRNIIIAVVVLIALVLMAFWPRGGQDATSAWSQTTQPAGEPSAA